MPRYSKSASASASKKSAKKSPPGAPLLAGAKTEHPQRSSAEVRVQTKKPVVATKRPVVRHVKVVQQHTAQTAVRIARHYNAVDAKAIRLAKRSVPTRLRSRISANRAANDGNLRVALPVVPRKGNKKRQFVISQKLKYIRHAALPVAVVGVLLATMLPAGAAVPGYASTRVAGGVSADTASDVTVDANGNVYYVGSFTGTVDFGADWAEADSKSSDTGSKDIFVTKVAAAGTYAWTKRIGGTDIDQAHSVAADSGGNVYIAGSFTGTVDFGADWSTVDEKTSEGGTDGFVTKINQDGTYGETWVVGGLGADEVTSLKTDTSGAVYAAGTFSDTVNFAADWSGSASKISMGTTDVFALKITNEGDLGWVRVLGGTGSDTADAIAIASNNAYIAGSFTGTVDFGADWSAADEKTSAGNSDAYITRVASDGSGYAWTKQLGGAGQDVATSLSVDEDDNLFIAGSFTGTVDFGADWSAADEKTSIGTTDGFVSKITSAGVYDWTRQFGGASATVNITSSAVGPDKAVYIAGSFADEIDFAGDTGFGAADVRTAVGAADAFVTEVASDGAYGWTRTAGAAASATANSAIYIADDNDVYLAGSFEDTVNFAANFAATDEKSSVGSTDIFLTHLTLAPKPRMIASAAGLLFEDADGVNLSSVGTTMPSPLVYVRDTDNTLMATVTVDMTEDRDWSALSGDTNIDEHKMYLAGVIGAAGAGETMTLYVPRNESDTAVVLCPDVTSLDFVALSCAGRQVLTENDASVAAFTEEGIEYWQITDVTAASIAAASIEAPGIDISHTDGATEVAEGGVTDYVTVRLQAAPTNDVTVTITANPSGQLESIDPIVFTPMNWATPVHVQVQAIDDALIEGEHEVAFGFTAVSDDELFHGASGSNLLKVTITDNDVAGLVWHNTDNLTSEAGDTAEICVTLTAQPTHAVTLLLASSDTSEVTVPANIVIEPADWNQASQNCFDATGVDDDLTDGPVVVTVSAASSTSDDGNFNNLDTGEYPTVSITNQDDDAAGFIVSTPDGTITTEAGGSVRVCVVLLARPMSGSVTIPVSINDTTEGTLGATTSLAIAAAQWSATNNCVTVTGVDDDMVDGDIQYKLVMGDPSADDAVWNAMTADDIADVVLTNEDDDIASVEIIETDDSTQVTEGGATDAIAINISSQPAPGKKVVIYAQPNTQIDLGNGAGEVVLVAFTDADWEMTKTITVTAEDDALVEGDHTADILFGIHGTTDEAPYSGLVLDTVTATIIDNDTAEVSVNTITDATEGGSNGVIRVTLSEPNNTGNDVAIGYSVAGTAVAGTHYAALAGSVTIPHGQSTADIAIAAIDNELLEGSKTVQITLVSSDHASITLDGESDTASAIVFDDESATASLAVAQHGQEAGPVHVVYQVSLDMQNNTGSPITVAIQPTGGTATADEDYVDFGGTISIADGQTAGAMEVTVLDDSLLEADTETLVSTISSPSLDQVSIDAGAHTAEAMITDNDTATVAITASHASAAEQPSDDGEFTISLNKVNNTGAAISVTYTVSGTATANVDYQALTGAATIASGQQSAAVAVSTGGYDDDDMEGDETVIITYQANDFGARITAGDPAAATVTIADDEIAGVTVHVKDNTTGEDGSTGEICFTLASRPAHAVTIGLSSAQPDLVSVPTQVLIERDNWSDSTANCVIATGLDDNPPVATGSQQVDIITGAVTSDDPFYAVLTGDDIDNVTMTHADNDTPGVIVHTISDQTSEDGSRSAVIRFTLNTQPTDDVTIPLSVSDPSEGSLAVNQIAITPADWNNAEANEVIVTGVDDDLTDGDIQYQLITGAPSSNDEAYNVLDADDIANVTLTNIDDDEASVAITESEGGTEVTEGSTTDIHAVSIGSQPASGNKVVIVATPQDTQIDLGSGAGQSVELEFTHENWSSLQTVNITATDDDLLEADHSSQIVYTIDGEATTEPAYLSYEESLPTIVVHITDNDTATAELSVGNGAEAGPVAIAYTIALSKENNTGSPITFTLRDTGLGSASATADYAAFDGAEVTIADGADEAVVQVGVVDDALFEGDETVMAELIDASIAEVVITQNAVTATIVDNDTVQATIIATDPTAAENPSENGVMTVYLSRVNNTGLPITVSYDVGGTATPDSDYSSLSGEVLIPVGQSSAEIVIDTTGYDDDAVEGNETVEVTLTGVAHDMASVGVPDVATVTIADDDSFTVHITKQQDGAEAGEVAAIFRVQLSAMNDSGNDITVDIRDTATGTATAGEDYTAFDDTLVIPDGEQYVDVVVPVLDDSKLEGAETIGAEISNPSQGDVGIAVATAIIADDETGEVTVVATESEAAENPSVNGEFTIQLSTINHMPDPILVSYTINGTATAGEDYAALSGTAMVPVGQDETVVVVNTAGFNDSIYEGDETVVLTLVSTSVAAVTVDDPATATVTITDDEQAPEPDPDPDPEPQPDPDSGQSPDPSAQNPAKTSNPAPRSNVVYMPTDPTVVIQSPVTQEPAADRQPQPVDQVREDLDRDGISDTEERKAHNNGDGNGDGIPDYQQTNVASRISSVTQRPVTLEALGECAKITNFKIIPQHELSKKDSRYKYPQGLVDYRLECDKAGAQAAVTVYYDQSYDQPGQWRKLMFAQKNFDKIASAEELVQPIGKNKVTTIGYPITDGGKYDDDGKINGKISDPAGFAVRTFYFWDWSWAVLVVPAAVFIAYGIRRRHREFKSEGRHISRY